MHPIVRKCRICHTFTLCNFIFMVRESQVLAARMDVDCITKVMAGHDTALDMPSRASLTPRGTPRSEEHTSELQSRFDLVCRLLLEKKENKQVYARYAD